MANDCYMILTLLVGSSAVVLVLGKQSDSEQMTGMQLTS